MGDAFTYGGGRVEPGELVHTRYPISETFLGEPIRIPLTICVGTEPGPTLFVSAAVHGDELNGVKVAKELASRLNPESLAGTVVILHVVNVPGYLAQQRYIPIYDQDLNRSFPGRDQSTPAQRIANGVFTGILRHCDYGIDLHTSTRGRTTTFHVRAQMDRPAVENLATAFGENVIISGVGEEENSLRTACVAAGIPTITIEMGEAHRFQEEYVSRALAGIRNVTVELGLEEGTVTHPSWRKVIDATREKTWLRSDVGGVVDILVKRRQVLEEGEKVCTITDHFGEREHVITAPYTGLVVGLLQNPIAQPGHPICHFVRLDDETRDAIERVRGANQSSYTDR